MNGFFSGIRLRSQNSMSLWNLLGFVTQGLMAPSLKDLEGSGMTRSMSMSITRPNPRQVSQAPNGLLKEKRLGTGS